VDRHALPDRVVAATLEQKSMVKPWATMRHAKCDDYNGLPIDSFLGHDLGALIDRAFAPIPVVEPRARDQRKPVPAPKAVSAAPRTPILGFSRSAVER
jgi:hypothetical protein